MEIEKVKNFVLTMTIEEIISKYPYTENFFAAIRLEILNRDYTLPKIVNTVSEDYFKEYGLTKVKFIEMFVSFIDEVNKKNNEDISALESITIIGGKNKDNEIEDCKLTIKRGEIVCIVGPTGAGKSRLLEDIECLAQKDTPTERRILLDNEIPSEEKRFNMENKLVAQLSQNMNFVMDLSVKAFVEIHAESRGVKNTVEVVDEVIKCANELAGERFDENVKVTELSGGQSRALMIADTALLSTSPIILIDEIENAGIDRKKAMDILVKKEKIILMSTHDPILALFGDKRIVIKNGGIKDIIETVEEERNNLPKLQEIDKNLNYLREKIRHGDKIDFDINKIF